MGISFEAKKMLCVFARLMCLNLFSWKLLTVVEFDKVSFLPSFSPPGRPVFSPPPGSPGYWRIAPSWRAGYSEYWCCPPCGTKEQF